MNKQDFWALWLLVIHAAALLLWSRFVTWEVGVNADMIKADGSADSLKDGFHQRRTWLRFWFWLALAALPAAVAWVRFDLLAGLLGFAAFGFLLGTYFARTFNPLLNVAMGLSYKARFYASPSPTAARWPDQYVWRQLRESKAEPTQENANAILQGYLNLLLGVGILAELGYLIFLVLHY